MFFYQNANNQDEYMRKTFDHLTSGTTGTIQAIWLLTKAKTTSIRVSTSKSTNIIACVCVCVYVHAHILNNLA